MQDSSLNARRSNLSALQAAGRFHGLADRLPGVVYACAEVDGRLTGWLYVSPRIEELLGYRAAEFLADHDLWDRLIDPRDAERVLQEERRALAAREPLRIEYRMLTRAGEVRWIQDEEEWMNPPGDEPPRYEGIVVDVTERRRTEEALRDSERRKAAMLDASLDAIVSIDPAGCVTEWNRAAELIFGHTRDQSVGRELAELVVPPESRDAHRHGLKRLVGGGPPRLLGQRTTVVAQRRDGSEFPVELTITRLEGEPSGFTATIRDISTRLADEQEREQIEHRLRQLERIDTVGQLAGGVAHDFNNLLSVILSFTRMARDELEGEDSICADLDEVIGAAERAARLTQQLLTFSRREPVRPEVLDLREVVRDMEVLLRRTIGEHVALQVDTGAPVPLVKADRSGLEQVVLNLAVNARDAMPGGGTLSIAVDAATLDASAAGALGTVAAGHFVRLVVTDTGEGIAPEVAEHMFEPFFTTKPKEMGTGLGLATVHGVVTQTGGGLRVDSAPGEGSTFEVFLPASISERVRVSEQERLPAGPVRGETVVIAQDEDAVRRVVCRVLDGAGYEVIAAVNGEEALERVASIDGDVDLLLTDVVMPGMPGRELARRASELRPGLAVLYCSGYTDDVALLRDLRDERVAFLEKPFNGPTLLAKVREVLDSRP